MFRPMVAGALALGLATAAHAAPVLLVSGTVNAINAATNPAPFALTPLGTSATQGFQSNANISGGGVTISFQPSAAPQGGLWAGTVNNIAVSPFTNTALTPTSGGQFRNYLAAQPNSSVTFAFDTGQNSFNLLWGTVDTFNSVQVRFFNGVTQVGLDTITGANVALSAGITANGSTPAWVSYALNNPAAVFNRVEFISTTNSAFEFAPGTARAPVPEPATWAMMIMGFGVIGAAMRRRSSTARVAA